MSKLAFVALVCALLAVTALAGAPSFSVCSGSDAILQNVKITTENPNWAGNSLVYFTISGTLTQDIAPGATAKDLAYFAGYEVDNREEDLCSYEGTPFQCPEATGEHSWRFPFQIPSVPIPGTLTAHSDFKNPDGTSILCFDLSVNL